MWHIVLNYVTVNHYRNSEACLYILSVFMCCILRFWRSWYGNLRCITVGGNSDARSLYRFILWPRIVIHKVSCLYFLPWSQKTPLSSDSINRGFPFTISVFLQLCVCVCVYYVTEIINGSSYFWHCTSHPVWVTCRTGMCYISSPLGGYQYFRLKCFLYL
jgi:hypothetical protein